MRTFKFRYWDGSQMREPYCEPGDLQVANINDELNDCPHLMQYTGLKDANGVEIYEGDILDGSDGPSKVVWRGAAWECDFADDGNIGLDEMCIWFGQHSTVIGNIYENPKLLKN